MKGNLLKEQRKKLGISGFKMAIKLGITTQQVYNYENGDQMPRLIDADRIAEAYGITVNELIKHFKGE